MTTGATPLPAPVPGVNPETREFWEATGQGRLLLKRCLDCGSVIWYPRAFCPECASLRTEWFPASGRGRVYSYTVNHRGEGPYREAAPFVLAYVELDEGPRVMTNVVEAAEADLAVGLPVEVVFHDTGEGTALPRFRPAAAPAPGRSTEAGNTGT
ncbi:MAG TPA: Zn-ribbon domain-containing OB-fold protein [Trebonia sp.]